MPWEKGWLWRYGTAPLTQQPPAQHNPSLFVPVAQDWPKDQLLSPAWVLLYSLGTPVLLNEPASGPPQHLSPSLAAGQEHGEQQ